MIDYSVANAGHVTLRVYDILGREIATLVNKDLTAGNHSVEFNASKFASGAYFYKLTSGSKTIVKKMMILK
jgi:hypothetical protein